MTTATRGVGARRRSVRPAAPGASVAVPGLDAGAAAWGRRPPSSVRLADVDERSGGPVRRASPALADRLRPRGAGLVRRGRRGGRAVDRGPRRGRDPARLGRGQVAPTTAVVRRPGAGRRPVRSASSLDIVLTERLSRAELRERIEQACPAGRETRRPVRRLARRAVDHGPARSRPTTGSSSAVRVRTSSRRQPVPLASARSLPRSRSKGDGPSVDYDLRPLILDLTAVPGPTPAGPSRATYPGASAARPGRCGRTTRRGGPRAGRALGRALDVLATVRERLLTIDDPAASGG